MNVRLNGAPTVHLAVTDGDRIVGRACNHWPGGGHRRLRAVVTADPVTCKSCQRIGR